MASEEGQLGHSGYIHTNLNINLINHIKSSRQGVAGLTIVMLTCLWIWESLCKPCKQFTVTVWVQNSLVDKVPHTFVSSWKLMQLYKA